MSSENLIHIQGGTKSDIKQALNQWIKLYDPTLKTDLTFQLFNNEDNNHILVIDGQLENDLFFFLVNYLTYPEGINYSVSVEGFTTGKNRNKLRGKKLLVFIPPSDQDYDNVFVTTTDNETFKVDFGGKISKSTENRSYEFPSFVMSESPEIIEVKKKNRNQKIATPISSATEFNTEEEIKIQKRFNIISLCSAIAFAITYIVLFTTKNTTLFQDFTMYLFVGIWAWFYSDDKMLHHQRFFLLSFCIATLTAIYGILLQLYFDNETKPLLFALSFSPLFLLLAKRILRVIFLTTTKREPEIVLSGNISDRLYSGSLILISILLPIILKDYFLIS